MMVLRAMMGILVVFEAGLLAVEVFLLASKPSPVTIASTVFVAVMLIWTIVLAKEAP